MILPKLVYKLVSIFLAGLVFFSSSAAVFATHQSVPVPHSSSEGQSAPTYYKVVPIPPPEGSQEVVPIPPPSSQNPYIQQANFLTDLAGEIGDIATLIGEVIWGGIQTAFGAMVSAALYLFEHALLIQFAGTVADSVMDVFTYNDPQEAMARFQEIAADPSSFGSVGAIGVFQGVNDSIVSLSVPISTSNYFASINPFESASAQGAEDLATNFNGVLLGVWLNVRNASLALMVAALVIIGFMIMLRWSTGPRTSVTVQNALPRIALALLLIWFSFGISGLMLDLTRVASNVFNLIIPSGLSVSGIFNILTLFVGSSAMIWVILKTTALFTGLSAALVVIALLLLLLLAIVIVVVYTVIIYKLLTRYIIFILLTMFAPFFFLVGAVPGMEGAIYTWFKRAFAALIAIPLTGLVLQLAYLIGFSGFGGVGPSDTLRIAGDVQGAPGFNLIGGVVGGALAWIVAAPIIGLGLFFFATKVPDMVDELFRTGLGGGGRRGGGFGPMAIIGAPIAAMQTAGNVGRAWKNTQGVREAVGRGLIRAGAKYPSSVERFEYNQKLSGLSPDRHKLLAGPLRAAGAVYRDPAGEERIKQGTMVEMPPEGGAGVRGAVAHQAVKRLGPLFGAETPTDRVIVKTPDTLDKEEELARQKARMSPGGKTSRT